MWNTQSLHSVYILHITVVVCASIVTDTNCVIIVGLFSAQANAEISSGGSRLVML